MTNLLASILQSQRSLRTKRQVKHVRDKPNLQFLAAQVHLSQQPG